MPEDASITDFVGGTGAEDAEGDAADDERDEDVEVEPAAVTYEWTSGDATCADCGASVSRRWAGDDGAMVCAECKDW